MFKSVSLFLFLSLSLFISEVWAQDSIPPPATIDTMVVDSILPTVVDTIVIRQTQYKVNVVPRGVRLTVPIISFNETKVLTKRRKQFVVPSFWTKENELGINMQEVAFVNWNAGGENSVTATMRLKFVRNYKFRYITWDNDLEMKYGINAQEDREARKTDDAIRLSSTFGYRNDTLSPWYYSVKGKFNTQFTDGFNYPDRTNAISGFMSPGYLFIGGGVSYIPEGQKFNLYLSPASFKTTFVLDEELSNKGAFGVEKGEKTFSEFGILVTNTWDKNLWKNVTMIHKLSLYTDYIRSFGNIDVDWELVFRLKVNNLLQAEIGTHIIYDDDIKFDREVADDGTVINEGEPRIQLRQFLGIGILYTF